MMQELSLNILDVVQNAITAGATLIEIAVQTDSRNRLMTVSIADNGCGMTPEQLSHAADPFFTTRSTRRVGLGIPLFKLAAEITGGSFQITSQAGAGTALYAEFRTDSIDCMPLGDLGETFTTLITCNERIDFVCTRRIDDRLCTLDTRTMRSILEDVPLSAPEVAAYLRAYFRADMPAEANPAWGIMK